MALLALLFMRGPGTGSQDGDAESSSELPAETEMVAAADTSEVLLTSETQSGGLTEDEEAALSGNTLIVLIDEYDYLMQVSEAAENGWKPVDLDRLVEVAQQAKGDSNGIRVRIQKRVTARASAEQAILTALERGGIGADAIFESSELVD